MKKLKQILIATTLLNVAYNHAPACTGFAMKDADLVLACLSYDHQFGDGHVYVNKRNVERQRHLLLAEKPFRWVSQYGNITFNLVGRDYPHDGMNEAGLVVLSMGLDDTRFPPPDNRPALDELGWIQYQLDTADSTKAVIESLKKVRISSRSIGDSHFLIVDRTGKAAVIEYVDGQMRIYSGDDLPFGILANDTYSNLLAAVKRQKAFGGSREDPYRVGSSCCRFTRVAAAVREYSPTNGPMADYAFTILSEVRQGNSQYQVVYDALNRCVQYRSLNSREVKTIRFSEMDFDCAAPALMTEIQSPDKGNIARTFHAYDANGSRKALIEFNKSTFGYLPMETLTSLADTPCQSACLSNALPAPVTGTKGQGKADSPEDGLVASLKPPVESRIVVTNGDANIVLSFAVKLNRAVTHGLDFAFEVPYNSGLVPGDNVFITPNPVRIEKGNQSVDAKVIIIAGRLRPGSDTQLIVNLLSPGATLGSETQFAVLVRRETTAP